jgi:hypothetical protein
VTGSVQWKSLDTAHWFVYSAWYGTLLLSLVSVMVAFYLSILLSNFGINTAGNTHLLTALQSTQNKKKARWGSLFALQVPIMLLSYSLIAYVVGLTLLVMRPLWTDPWGPSTGVCIITLPMSLYRMSYERLMHLSQIAIGFSVFLFISITTFASVCHFIYVQNEEVLKVV